MSRTDSTAAALAQIRRLEDAIELHLDDKLSEKKPKRAPLLIRDGKRGPHRELAAWTGSF